MSLIAIVLATSMQFADVPPGHWAANAVESLAKEKVLVGYPPEAQSETFGKTANQIVALGRTKWFEFYTAKAGESTLSMASAERIFGESLRSLNNSRLRRANSAVQQITKKLRPLLTDLGGKMIQVASALSGGGTIWTPVRAGLLADVEEVIDFLLGNRREKITSVTTAEISNQLDHVVSQLKSNAASIDSMAVDSPKSSEAIKLVQDCRELVRQIAVIAKASSRAESSRILAYCLKFAKVPETEETMQEGGAHGHS